MARYGIGLLLGVGAFAFAGHALAQVAAQSAAAPSAAPTGDEIIVTATRRAERLLDVPAAISVVQGQSLREGGFRQLQDVAEQTAGVQIFRFTTGQPTFIIRGVGLVEPNPNNPPPASTYQDDVYQFTTAQAQVSLFDTNRVEVLKGPQGGLYGRNTTGGVVRVVSREPDLTKPSVDLSATYARFDRFTFDGGASVPIVKDKLAIRLAGVYESGGGSSFSIPDNRHWGDADKQAFRATVLAEPSPGVRFKLIVDHARDTSRTKLLYSRGARALPSGGGAAPLFYCPAINAGRPLDPSCLSYPGVLKGLGFAYLGLNDPNAQSSDGRSVNSNAFGQFDIDDTGFQFRGDFDLGPATFTSITAYRDFKYNRTSDSDATSNILGHGVSGSRFNVWNESLRLASNGKTRFRWAAGFDYADERLKERRDFIFTDDPFAASSFRAYGLTNRSQADGKLAYDQRSETFSGYGELAYDVTRTVEARFSARYTDLFKRYTNGGINFPLGTGPVNPLVLPLTQFTLSNDYHLKNNGSGNATLSWKPNTRTLFYGTIGRGIKEGGFAGGFPTQGLDSIVAFREETVWSYEVGGRARFLNNRLGVNADVFYYDYGNAQTSVPVRSQLTGAIFGRPGNVDAEHRGAEAEVFVVPFTGFRLDGSVTYLDAHYTGDTQFTTQDGTRVSYKGLYRPFAPEWSWTARASYERALGNDLGTVSASIDANGRTDRIRPYIAPTGTNREYALNYLGGYTLVNARVGWRDARDRYRVGVFGRNILNKTYISSPVTDGNGSFAYLFGEVATYGVELGFRY